MRKKVDGKHDWLLVTFLLSVTIMCDPMEGHIYCSLCDKGSRVAYTNCYYFFRSKVTLFWKIQPPVNLVALNE